MNKCEDCANAIYCQSWGEFKCEVKQARLRKKVRVCKSYKKKDANAEEKKCHCLICMARENESE